MSAFEFQNGDQSFSDYLKPKLPLEVGLRVHHVCSPASACPAIFATLPGQNEERTTCESHFLAISQKQRKNHVTALHPDVTSSGPRAANGDGEKSGFISAEDEVLVFGIEVLIFDSATLTTIFVSKADSTGFLHRKGTSASVSTGRGSPSIIKIVTSAFLEWLVVRQLESQDQQEGRENRMNEDAVALINSQVRTSEDAEEGANLKRNSPKRKRLVLSLFARSQNQYLFPGSIENETKHVLNDRQLIKWWCRVIDSVVQQKWTAPIHDGTALSVTNSSPHSAAAKNAEHINQHRIVISPKAFLIVPGCDRLETTRLFLPQSARFTSALSQSPSPWSVSYPVELLNRCQLPDEAPPPIRCVIPRLPDDPKARFCDDLDDSGVDEKKEWKAIKTLDQFWEMMSYRQECSAGSLVGFAWVVFDLPQQEASIEEGVNSAMAATRAERHTELQSSIPTEASHQSRTDAHAYGTTHSGQLDGGNQENQPRYNVQNRSTKNTVVLSTEDYNKLAGHMINDSDFGGINLAKKSTRSWVAKIRELSGRDDVGVTVYGQAISPIKEISNGAREAHPTTQSPQPQRTKIPTLDEPVHANVNILVGIRKRKRNTESEHAESPSPQSNLPDTSTAVGERTTTLNHINRDETATILSASLVRKKPKPITS